MKLSMKKNAATFLFLLSAMSLCSCQYERMPNEPEDGVNLPEYSIITMGSYPTSLVPKALSYKLNDEAPKAPTLFKDNGWNKIDDKTYKNLYFYDLDYEGEKYRAIYYSSPALHFDEAKANGYKDSITYWFKYEPVKWFVYNDLLDRKCAVTLDVIDNYVFYNVAYNIVPFMPPFCYSESPLRTMLNEKLYNSVFNDEEKALIEKAEYRIEEFDGTDPKRKEDIVDNVSIPSYYDVSYSYPGKELRNAKASDYAKAMGALNYTEDGQDFACYWLRTDSAPSLHWSTLKGGYVLRTTDETCGIRPCVILK